MDTVEEDRWGCDWVTPETASRIKWGVMLFCFFVAGTMLLGAFHYYGKEKTNIRTENTRVAVLTCLADKMIQNNTYAYIRCAFYIEEERHYWSGLIPNDPTTHNITLGEYYKLYARIEPDTGIVELVVWDRNALRVQETADYYFIIMSAIGAVAFFILLVTFLMAPKKNIQTIKKKLCFSRSHRAIG